MSVADSDSDDESSVLDEGFVRLPNAARLEPNEAYDFVTVAFPGSYMIALGLLLSEDRASEYGTGQRWPWVRMVPPARCGWLPTGKPSRRSHDEANSGGWPFQPGGYRPGAAAGPWPWRSVGLAHRRAPKWGVPDR